MSIDEEFALSRRVKYILTIALYFCYVTFSLASSLLGPARLDIVELVNSDFHDVSYGQSGRAVGYVLGALLSGWLFSKINRQMGGILSLILTAAFTIIVPFTRTLWLYLVTETLFGFTCAGIDVVCNSWMLEIWQQAANPYMQGMHFSFALGQTIAPLIVEPFLSADRNATDSTVGSFVNSTLVHEETRILIPYSISALLLLAAAAFISYLYYKMPYVDPKRTVSGTQQDDNNDPPAGSPTSSSSSQLVVIGNHGAEKLYYRQMIILGCLFLFSYTGIETSTSNFLPEFAVVIDLKLSKSKAAFLSSVMSGSWAVSRLISIPVATKLRTKTMLYISYTLLCVGNLMLLFFANTSEVMLWTAAVVIGSGQSCVWPCFMSFLEERMNVTTGICSLFMLCSILPTVPISLLIGSYVERYPMIYVHINLLCLSVCLLVFGTLYIIDRRFRREKPI